MTDDLGRIDEYSTPLNEEERENIISSYITSRRELNEAEQANILVAQEWVYRRKKKDLDERFLVELHMRMFNRVWRWAGKLRLSEKNIGIDPRQISVELRLLFDDCRYWVENHTYHQDETATRFHHRLVKIHPFTNGNGRLSRLATDVLLASLGGTEFSWGSINLVNLSDTRRTYIAALRAADKHDLEPLLKFVRS